MLQISQLESVRLSVLDQLWPTLGREICEGQSHRHLIHIYLLKP